MDIPVEDYRALKTFLSYELRTVAEWAREQVLVAVAKYKLLNTPVPTVAPMPTVTVNSPPAPQTVVAQRPIASPANSQQFFNTHFRSLRY